MVKEHRRLEDLIAKNFICILDGANSGINCTAGSRTILLYADDFNEEILIVDEGGKEISLSYEKFINHYILEEKFHDTLVV